MASRIRQSSGPTSHQQPPPSSYTNLSPTDQNNTQGKDNASSTRSNRSSTFSLKATRGIKRVFGILKDNSEPTLNSQPSSPLVNGRKSTSILLGGRVRNNSTVSAVASFRRDSESTVVGRRQWWWILLPVPTCPFDGRAQVVYKVRTQSRVSTITYVDQFDGGCDGADCADGYCGRGSSLQDGLPLQRSIPLPLSGLGAERVIDGLPESIRRSLDSRPMLAVEGTGVGGLPPKGARGAVATPPVALTTTPNSSEINPTPPANNTLPTNEPPLSLHQRRSESITTLSNDSHDSSNSNHTTTNSTIRTRPPKPNLSIPIPPRLTNENTPVITSRSNSTGVPTATMNPTSSNIPASPTQMKCSPSSPLQSAHLRSATTPSPYTSKSKSPPSPGLSLRLTPSIVMSRPIWPLPPLPNTDIPPVPSITTSKHSPSNNSPPSDSSPSDGNADRDEGSRMRRSMSVKLNAMPSLNVMGETETVRPEPSPPTEPPTASTNEDVVVEAAPSKDKGKGKARRRSKDDEGEQEDGSASDSDDSVYFDARGSVFLSPKDVAKALERRHSQMQPIPRPVRSSEGGGVGAERSNDADAERERRNSSWSFSTNGRESIYLTPMESVSPWRTPGSSALLSHQTDLLNNNSAFAKELANKRSSVPAAFAAPFGAGASNSGTSSRKEMRFSMSNASQVGADGLPNIDMSGLNFDPSIFKTRTPSSDNTPKRTSLRFASA
ncbi:12129_t:CDS:2, partial [Acaulospora colombiana]